MKNKNKFIICMVFLIICITFLLLNTAIQTTDDYVYKNAFCDFSSFYKWVGEFYCNWSGRIIVSSLINLFTNMPIWIFKISNTVVFFIFIGAIYWICNVMFKNIKINIKAALIVCIPSLFYLINLRVINSGVIWLTGALNYFWPATFMLVSLIPFISELKSQKFNSKYFVIFFLSNLISAMVEQSGLVLVCFGIVTLIWLKIEKKKINKLLLIHFLIIFVLFMICMLAPGNIKREFVEELGWYSDFSMTTIFERFNQGFHAFMGHIVKGNMILIVYLVGQLIYLMLKNESRNKFDCWFIVIIVMYLLWAFLFKEKIIINLTSFEIKKIYKYEDIIKIALNYIMIGFIGIELWYSTKDVKNGLIVSVLYFASVCSTIVLGFSPTVYASGNRVFILTDFLIILINSLLCVEIFEKNEKNKWIVLYTIITIIIASDAYVNLFTNGITKILY